MLPKTDRPTTCCSSRLQASHLPHCASEIAAMGDNVWMEVRTGKSVCQLQHTPEAKLTSTRTPPLRPPAAAPCCRRHYQSPPMMPKRHSPKRASVRHHTQVWHLAFNGRLTRRPPRSWTEFGDEGSSPWWYIYAPGSGVFYHAGRESNAFKVKTPCLGPLSWLVSLCR